MMHLSEAAMATQGKLIGRDVLFTSVGTDSRKLAAGQLFVALRGIHFDGHDYAVKALAEGAVAVMVSASVPGVTAAIEVADTRLALGELAAHWRRKFAIPLAAITGSNGKTTVKEMLAAILRAQVAQELQAQDAATLGEGVYDAAAVSPQAMQAVLATEGNLNNDIGLPLTLLKLRDQHRYAVAEMGMNHRGEIRYLSHIGAPTVALVNNAGTAHIGELGSVEAIAQAKGEIFEGLAPDGVAVINADDAYAPLWQALAAPRKVATFGLDVPADVTAEYRLAQDHSVIAMKTPIGEITFDLPSPGLHNVRNALAAATAALAMGASLTAVGHGLAHFSGAKGRLQTKAGAHGATVIDDSYNANPASVRAAIDVLAAHEGKRLLVLGDMGELGEDAASMHAEIGAYAREAGIDGLYALGELSRHTVTAFGTGASLHEGPEALAAALDKIMRPDTVVLVKGSRFMKMERVVARIANDNTSGEAH
ncbi:MAG TPA: UDP-N-acetylmuramoyl-tripeptide--D-alanyl-D-alanine ligase [Methylophilaceae bacterium]|nr:UDP-N-acetylmuramoyl-tripeptide--D-alanyl-D-alanine ligase [Methylophilaceae bacterium]